jgi:hypothetical protein
MAMEDRGYRQVEARRIRVFVPILRNTGDSLSDT